MNCLKKFVQRIKKSKKIVIATHIDPDADGIAAALSSGYLARHYTRRRPVLYCHSPIARKYRFLLGDWKFVHDLPEFDTFIAVDSAGISRIFPDKQHIMNAQLDERFVINIDHHKSNDSFGQIRIVEETVSSACEIIYKLFQSLKVPIDRKLAEIFYCGIYSETGGFVYPNTTEESLKIASELVSCGVKPGPIAKKLNSKTIAGTMLLSEVLNTIQVRREIGVMVLSQRMLRKHRAKMDDSEHFVSFLQAIDNVRISVFLREEGETTRISLRSDGLIDVDEVAARFGGGGHRLAAGVRMRSDIAATRKKILREIYKAIKKKKK